MGNNAAIVAGTGAAGADGTGLAWFGNVGSPAPTDATTALNAAYTNAGLITEDGLTVKLNTSSKDVRAYGSLQKQRVILTDASVDFNIAFLEVNKTSQAVFWGLPLNAINPTVGTGAFSLAFGVYTRQLYSVVFDIIDGTNHMRFYCPSVEVTNRNDLKVANAAEVAFSVTLSAYPNTSGVAVQMYDVIPALG